MIVFNNDVLFVHNPKTAGTSLIAYLQSTLTGEVRSAGVHQLGTYHPSLSMAFGYACGITEKREFDRVISVIRNPFDREVSMYCYFREVLSASPGLRSDLPDAAMQKRVGKAAELDFPTYLQWLWDEGGTVDIWQSRCFYQMAEGTRLDALRVLKFENLEADLADALALPAIDLPTLNASARRPMTQYYDDQSVELVRRSYDWMFKAGYYADSDIPTTG